MTDLHRDAAVVDCHLDLVLTLNRPGIGDRATLARRWLPELREGGVDVQVVPVYAEGLAEAGLRTSLDLIAALYREIELTSEVELCLNGGAIRDAVSAGRIAFVLALEGASCLGTNPDLVGLYHRLGVRMISLAHYGRTMLADGSGEDGTGGRLTRAGIAVVSEMERLGIMLDVSHLGIAGVDHVLELASRPMVASHSVARALHDHHRNMSDAHIRAVALAGGVICANGVAGFVDPDHPTLDRVVDHIEHMVEIAGEDHVGIGTDHTFEIFEDIFPPQVSLIMEGIDARQRIEGFWASRHMPNLTEALVRRGFTESQVRGILGENLLRLFDAELGIPRAHGGAEEPSRSDLGGVAVH